jgi:hypothetical protein
MWTSLVLGRVYRTVKPALKRDARSYKVKRRGCKRFFKTKVSHMRLGGFARDDRRAGPIADKGASER